MKQKKQQARGLQDQVLEHIHRKLQERFGNAGADRIMQRLSTRLWEMTQIPDVTISGGSEMVDGGKAAGSVGNETADSVEKAGTGEQGATAENTVFITQLNSIVYPFLALMQALEELPTDAAPETLRIWNTLPWTVVDKARRG